MTDELPDINVTRGEKALAFVLAVFLLVGGLWVYFEPLTRESHGAQPTPQQQAAIAGAHRARDAAERTQTQVGLKQDAYEQAREDYRTDLDANTSTKITKPRFEQARSDLDTAHQRAAAAEADADRLGPAGDRAQEAVYQAETDADDRASLYTFLLRLGWVLGCIALAFWVFNQLRRRRSAYFVAGVAGIMAATTQALVMAGQYLGDEIDWQNMGPLWIAVAGITASLLALVALERYLARRAPRRRVRKGQCPYCAYPVNGAHCEGCGRATIAECTTCAADRRVGTAHCVACGAT